MKKEKCFKCDNEEIEIIEAKEMLLFQCQVCLRKWGKYDIRE